MKTHSRKILDIANEIANEIEKESLAGIDKQQIAYMTPDERVKALEKAILSNCDRELIEALKETVVLH